MNRKKLLHYRIAGEGTAILFLHGFLESSEIWVPIIGHFKQHYKCIIPDLPGHGQSISGRSIEEMSDIADDIIEILDREGVDSSIVVGHSMGGYVGIELLRHHPERVRKLCLLNSHAAGDSSKKKEERKRVVPVIKNRFKSFVSEAIPNLFAPPNRVKFQKEIKDLTDRCVEYDPDGVIACSEGMCVREAGIDVLRDSKIRCCIVAGDLDPIMPLEDLRKQAEETGSKIYIVKKSGHMSYIENKEETIDYLGTFLNN